MVNAEEVVINIVANGNGAIKVFDDIKRRLMGLQLRANYVAQNLSKMNSNIPNVPKIDTTVPSNNLNGPKLVGNTPSSKSKSKDKDDSTKQTTLDDVKVTPKVDANKIVREVQTKLDDINTTPKVNGNKITREVQTRLDDVKVTPKVDGNKITREVQTKLDSFNQSTNTKVNVDSSSVDTATSKVRNMGDAVKQTSRSFDDSSKKVKNFGKQTQDSMKVGLSAFHEMNTMLTTVGAQFTDMSTKIAGLFGAMGLGGMIEKMWQGAADRQTNMLYLIHQKGVEEANEYYSEIMDIVTQLPGDDTFLTNVLNMASALDSSVKLDNLKELGTAITDYYIASTMKGELPFDTRAMRNSLLASELDLLKDKNNVLERMKALQEALDNTGLTGMSEYESATNELEEFKGHFQKAFADIGAIVTGITQPLMKFYNTLDTIFGSRISQGIILVATAFVTLFAVIGTTMVIFPLITRNFEILGMGLSILNALTDVSIMEHGLLNGVLTALLGPQNAYAIAVNGSVTAGIKDLAVRTKRIIATKLGIKVTEKEIVSLRTLGIASLGAIKTKLVQIATSIKHIIVGDEEARMTLVNQIAEMGYTNAIADSTIVKKANTLAKEQNIRASILLRIEKTKHTLVTLKNTLTVLPNTIARWKNNEATFIETLNEELNTLAKGENTVATTINTSSKIANFIETVELTTAIIYQTIVEWRKNESSLAETMSEVMNTASKEMNTNATLLNASSKLFALMNTIELTISVVILTITEWRNTESTFAEALAHNISTASKVAETMATYGLATAMAVLEAVLSPIGLIILAIVGVLLALVVVVEKVGEAFGWWKDFGSMFEAISNGINRIWEAFKNSEVIQGIIKYFSNFAEVVKYLWQSITGMFAKLFGWTDTGTFDIVQTIIDLFGKLGEVIKWVWNLLDDWSNSPLGLITWLNPLGIILCHLDEIGSLFEDIGDAINRFTESTEFQALAEAFSEVWTELQEPFQEIWSLLEEIGEIFAEVFSDPEGQGTEERINVIVEIFKALATVIRVLVIPAIKGIAIVMKVILTPIKIVLMTIKGLFEMVQKVSNAVKNSFIGKIMGWDKVDDEDEPKTPSTVSRYNQAIGNWNNPNLTASNVNNVRNLGSTYNNQNNQRQVIINQNFAEGSMPIDARNMTKKEAKKMFIGAFGYNRSVGSHGILR